MSLTISIGQEFAAFSLDVSLEVGPEPLALVGPNGSGKTTLLLAILGIHRPQRGRIALDPEVLFDAQQGLHRPTEERRIAYVPQDYGLFPYLSAQQNVEFALRCAGQVGSALECLAHFGVAHLARRRPAHLSGGERQRVALARAIATRPRALLLDEPTAALDVQARTHTRALLAAHLRELGIPTILVTHDREDVAALAKRVAVMEQGRVVAVASLSEARILPPTAFCARLLAA